MSYTFESAIQSCDTGQRMPYLAPVNWVGTLSRVIKLYQEMYKNTYVYPCIAM